MGSSDKGGWIKLHRKIIDNWIWEDPEKLKAWIDILLMVNHEDRQVPFNGHIITIKRGQKLTSIAKLSDRWGWNRKRVARFLDLLEEAGMCLTNRTTNGTTIFVQNYGLYQDFPTTEGTTNGTTNGTATGSAVGSQTRIKELKKERIYMAAATQFSPPSVENVREYCEKRQNGIDPEQFVSYYTARGWKLSRGQVMTDWKAQVRYWERNRKQKQAEKTDVEHPAQRDLYNELEDEIFGN